MKIKPIKTRIFKEGGNLLAFILDHIGRLKDGSILVVTSKIAALAEGRTAKIKDAFTKEKLIKSESKLAIKTKLVWLTVKDDMVMASAGIDESNADGKLIMLPKNSFKTAELLRKALCKKFGINRLGIIITDSRTAPLRAGVTGAAIGYAGFKGIKDYKGKKDLFGRKFKFSRVNVADSLASAAVLLMGEGGEQMPLAVIEDATVQFCTKVNCKELRISLQDDMYRPLFMRSRI